MTKRGFKPDKRMDCVYRKGITLYESSPF